MLSLSFILERLFFCLRNDNLASVFINIEKRGKREDRLLLDHYNKVLDMGTHFVTSDKFRRIIKRFESFYKNENIIGLQVSDLCAYPLARNILYPSIPYIPYDIIKDKIYCDKKGNILGYGLKIFP